MKMIVKRCYVYWRKACQITSGKFEAFGRIDFRYDRGEKLILSQHGIHHNLFFNMGFFPFWWCFFSQHAMSRIILSDPIRILSNEAESPRNFQRKEPPTDSSFHLSIHSCSSVFVDAQSLKESEEIQTSATNAGKPITVVWVVRFVWLLLVVVLGFCCSQLSCFWFGYLVALCFACLLGGGFERCERWEKTLPNYVPSQPWFLLTAKLSSNPILGSSSQTWRRIKNPQKTGFQQKTKLHPFIDLKGNHPSPAYNCSPQPSSSAWSQAPDFVQHKAWIKWSVQHKLPEP